MRWGAAAFDNFRVVPPGTGICHQVNLEYLAQTVWTKENGAGRLAFPDTLVGTDSHTTMVNGLSVLGWGVGGIEAEAAMLGQPISMLIPEVVGFRLTGELKDGVTATDLVLTVTEMLRRAGVVGKFVEFFGTGLAHLPLEDRATIANMAPEYGATCGFFPVDEETLAYLAATARRANASRWSKPTRRRKGSIATAIRRTPSSPRRSISTSAMSSLRSRDRSVRRIACRYARAASAFAEALDKEYGKGDEASLRVPVKGRNFDLGHGDVVIAAITSCTNTSNPSVMVAAGLLAKNAVERGLRVKPWVKTSLAPGSQVVTDYLAEAGLTKPLDALGFNLVGYGCTTCIGNSGPLPGRDLPRHPHPSPGRRGRPLRQPQFRGPRQSRRARQLSRLAAARRGLCARGLASRSTSRRSRSGPAPTARRSISRTSGRRRRTSPRSCARR